MRTMRFHLHLCKCNTYNGLGKLIKANQIDFSFGCEIMDVCRIILKLWQKYGATSIGCGSMFIGR